jgi:hypothetical protein
VNSTATKRDRCLANPTWENHCGVKVVMEASFDVSLPLGASHGVRDERGLYVPSKIGVGVGARDRDVGVGHWIRGCRWSSLLSDFRRGMLQPCRRRVFLLSYELNDFFDPWKRRDDALLCYSETSSDDCEANRSFQVCA